MKKKIIVLVATLCTLLSSFTVYAAPEMEYFPISPTDTTGSVTVQAFVQDNLSEGMMTLTAYFGKVENPDRPEWTASSFSETFQLLPSQDYVNTVYLEPGTYVLKVRDYMDGDDFYYGYSYYRDAVFEVKTGENTKIDVVYGDEEFVNENKKNLIAGKEEYLEQSKKQEELSEAYEEDLEDYYPEVKEAHEQMENAAQPEEAEDSKPPVLLIVIPIALLAAILVIYIKKKS